MRNVSSYPHPEMVYPLMMSSSYSSVWNPASHFWHSVKSHAWRWLGIAALQSLPSFAPVERGTSRRGSVDLWMTEGALHPLHLHRTDVGKEESIVVDYEESMLWYMGSGVFVNSC